MKKIIDVNSNEYPIVKIGNQIWMSENLKCVSFQNNEMLHLAKNRDEWIDAHIKRLPCCCDYDFNEEYRTEYGLFYNKFAILDQRWLAPNGWRIPKLKDVEELINNLKDNFTLSKEFISLSGYLSGYVSYNTTWDNMQRLHKLANYFKGMKNNGRFWTNEIIQDYDNNLAKSLNLSMLNGSHIESVFIELTLEKINLVYTAEESLGLSVRCLKN
jgi:uncharacterized protein (TIGR02145 family)